MMLGSWEAEMNLGSSEMVHGTIGYPSAQQPCIGVVGLYADPGHIVVAKCSLEAYAEHNQSITSFTDKNESR